MDHDDENRRLRATTPGSCFAPPASVARPRPRSPQLSQLSILVVEDEADSRELIELLLASEGATVHSAGGALEALDILDEVMPDVLLSDIGMPGRDGYWLARQVRARRPDITAIALTAFSAQEDIEHAMAAGFDYHVGKPLDPEQLVRALTGRVTGGTGATGVAGRAFPRRLR